MPASVLSKEQSQALGRILGKLFEECEATAVVVCDTGANIVARESKSDDAFVETVSALAAGAFAATRELADVIGEPRFKSISHRGEKSGVLIQSLGEGFLIVIVLSESSTEGLVRLYLKKVSMQLESILERTGSATAQGAVAMEQFEVEETPEEPDDEGDGRQGP